MEIILWKESYHKVSCDPGTPVYPTHNLDKIMFLENPLIQDARENSYTYLDNLIVDFANEDIVSPYGARIKTHSAIANNSR